MKPLNKLFYLISATLLVLAVWIFLSPSMVIADILYPQRYDSSFVAFLQLPEHQPQKKDIPDILNPGAYNPGDLSIPYQSFSVTSDDGVRLDAWDIPSNDSSNDRTIVLLHDLNQGRLSLLESIKQFHDRGFSVLSYDMRAHGTSGGDRFSAGLPSMNDLIAVVRAYRERHAEQRIILFGSGVSCAVVYLYAAYLGDQEALVLESPFDAFDTYLRRQAREEWGIMAGMWIPVLRKEVEKETQIPVNQLDMKAMARWITTPTLFLGGSEDRLVFLADTYNVYDTCGAEQKALILIREARHGELAIKGGERYYDGISSFLHEAVPQRQKPSARKRIAVLDDQQGNHREDSGYRPN